MIELTLDNGDIIWVSWEHICAITQSTAGGSYIHFQGKDIVGVKQSFEEILEEIQNLQKMNNVLCPNCKATFEPLDMGCGMKGWKVTAP